MASTSNGGRVLPRNKLSAWEWITLVLTVLPLPVILLWAIIKSPFSALGRSRSWKRILLDRAALWAFVNLNRRQLRLVFGEAPGTYAAYMKSKKLQPVVEEIGEDGRLLWIGSKKTERVILYIHGGALLFGPFESSLVFWGYIQENLQKRGKPTGVALLNYSLVPDATFPTQLKQAVLAIQHLINSGVKPENIQLAGDSAGGLNIHQVFSHILHPVDGVPKLKLSAPLGGAYMMAPWVTTIDDEVLHTNDEAGDVLTASALIYWGRKIHEGLPTLAKPYLNANGAPKDWLKGLDKVVKQILISAGDVEVLRDAVIKYFKTVEKDHKNVTLFLHDKGAHDETFLLFFTGDEDSKLSPLLLDWLEQGFL
jgi:acetyl esterase/lipase